MNETTIIRSLLNKKNLKLDDCFFFDEKYLVTTDSITENTHFKHIWSSPQNIANKLVEVNVSDIAASGGLPRFAFLNLGLSKYSSANSWLKPFIKQLKKKLHLYEIELAGGDTYKSETTNLSLTVLGITKKPILRFSGKSNQYIYLTGSLGLSFLGYRYLKDKINISQELKRESLKKHLEPISRLHLSQHLIKNYKISAMMDITDGLVQDSEKLALASNIEMQITIDSIPRFSEFKKYITTDDIIHSGEELELLFLSSQFIRREKNFPVTLIGKTNKITKKPKVLFYLDRQIYHPKSKGFLHF